MSISEIAVKRPLLILVIFTVLLLFGLQSYFQLNYNLLPKMKMNVISVNTMYPGASAAEVETSVTKKLEDSFASIEGLDKITSSSQQGISQITVNLKNDADVDKAQRDIQHKSDMAQQLLPDGIDKPQVNKMSLDETAVIQAGVTSKLAPEVLYNLIDKQLKPLIQNIRGVGTVNIIGGEERQIRVNLDQGKLKGYNLTVAQITQTISNANLSFPAGNIETKKLQLSIRYDANITSIDQMKELIVSQTPDGGRIYLKNVAEVVDARAKVTAINHINGNPSIGIQVLKQTDANTVEVSLLVKQKFIELEKQYNSQKIKFKISTDQSIYTLSSAHSVMEDLILAILIVGIVMLAFLHSIRSSFFVLVALPASIIPTFIIMYLMDFSLNMMSLMGLSLVVGILVDDSIVVLENIYRHMEMGSDRRKAALEGRNEIGFTALAITLVDVVVFLPLALSGGLIGAVLREFSLVVVFSTLMSLFVSFTITPMLASRFGKIELLNPGTLWGKINIGLENLIDTLKSDYGNLLGFVLRKKRWLLSGVILLILASFTLLVKGFIGAAFIPSGDQGEVMIKLELAPSATIYETNMLTQVAEKIILAKPEVTNIFSSIGFVNGSIAGTNNNSNLAELALTLKDRKERTVSSEEFGLNLQQELNKKIPGVRVTATAPSIAGGGNQVPIQIAVKGVDIKSVRKIAETFKALITDVPGTKFVELSVKDQKQEVEITLDRDKMTLFGLNASQVGLGLQNSFGGDDHNKFKENGNEYDIHIGLDSYNRSDINNVKNLSFLASDGNSFLLSQFAGIRNVMGESKLERSDRLSSISINSNVTGRPIGSVADDIKVKLATVEIPAGITIEYLGDVKNQADAFGSLGIALFTAILLVYLIMVALYESMVYPFVVLFSIPVALIGAFLALALSMETLNIFTIIGMIMLLGLVSKNAILIVDFTNQLKRDGLDARAALITAGKERLRPILMTTLTMILGMLPIALATGAGSEIKRGMAWVIIGGLTSSMLLTLFVVPVIYLIIDEITKKINKKSA